MAGHYNTEGDTTYLKNRFTQNLNAGEKLVGSEFVLNVVEYPDLSVLIRSAQFPAMGRVDVEDFGQMGLGFTQAGALENKGEITISAAETITGTVLAALREVIAAKSSVTIVVKATPESTSGDTPDSLYFKLLHCKLRCDAVDLSTEDNTAIVRPNITVVYNWVDL